MLHIHIPYIPFFEYPIAPFLSLFLSSNRTWRGKWRKKMGYTRMGTVK